MLVAVRADVKVEMADQAERRQLGLGDRPDVPGQNGLHDAGHAGQRGERGVRARQRLRGVGDHASHPGREAGQGRLECCHLPARIGHAGQLKYVERDRMVGPARHARCVGRRREIPAVQLGERGVV